MKINEKNGGEKTAVRSNEDVNKFVYEHHAGAITTHGLASSRSVSTLVYASSAVMRTHCLMVMFSNHLWAGCCSMLVAPGEPCSS